MARPSYRDKILAEGFRVVHEKGFAAASVRDIVKAAGATLGSFTNHFASKEAFALEILDLYFAGSREMTRATLLNEALPPPDRLRGYLAANKAFLNASHAENGCLCGNFAAEASDHPVIRQRIVDFLAEVQEAFKTCLQAAVKSGDAPAGLDCGEMAAFLVLTLQGAYLLSKVHRSVGALDLVEKMLFEKLLRPAPAADGHALPQHN